MNRTRRAEPAAILAYATGVGLVFTPLVGIPVRFAFQEIAPLLVYGGAFFLGGAIGALLAPRQSRPHNS